MDGTVFQDGGLRGVGDQLGDTQFLLIFSFPEDTQEEPLSRQVAMTLGIGDRV